MGAPYIARAPKKVLVRIPRNEGYTTVPSGMATLRLIPSPLDKPQEAENTQTESQGASPLDRPPQFTTGVPTTYNRSLHTGQHPAVLSGGVVGAGPVGLSRGPGAASVQSEADRFVALQGRGVGPGPRGRVVAGAVYQNERSSSPGLHQHGLTPSAAAAGATGTTTSAHQGPRATPLHYQGHFTAHSGRCHQQSGTHSATGRQQQQQQQPPPFTDFIAGQVWRALMMASQQQQQQRQQQLQYHHQQQQQHHHHQSTGGRGPVVGGKRTRDVATAASPATQDDTDDEPSRKISRVTAAQAPAQGVQHGSGLQDAHQHTPQAVIYTSPAVTRTGLHINMPSHPSPPSSPQQQVYTTRFHTSIPTPPTTPPSIQHPCSPVLDDNAQLAHPESPKFLLAAPQQPMVPLSPPALSLPIMFPPVFPQSMTSIKSHPQQFSLSNNSSSSSSNSSGPVAGSVSGSGGRRGGCEGQGAPPHQQQQQASQLTVVAGVSSRPTHPLHRLSHHHPLAALLQPTHGGLLPVSAAAHGIEGAPRSPYLTAAAAATAPPTPMMRMVDRSGPKSHHQQQGVRTRSPPGSLYHRGLPLYTSSSSSNNTNDKTSYSRSTSGSSRTSHAHSTAGASPSPAHSDTMSHCT